ncbi:60S ribosomal protein L13a-4-like [Hibiscus syriacus]|uniref:60S ribosomal protein L13a-4-like n=1 Tax=Hibiscus syriacus TaxID=106335 RepID=A0A6A3B3H1_HIBSY|nr:60S ribosomal protein L13a-4-like [Hibiscus syriacus]
MWVASCLASCCAECACDACRTVVSGISRRSARIAYCGLFALSIVSWIPREVVAPVMENMPWINQFHKTPNRECFETDAVLRVSLEMISKFGSRLFLLVQVVLLLDFVHGWNDKWVGYDEQFWYIALFVVSLVCYLATFDFSRPLFHWFTPSGSLVVFINHYVLVVSIATHHVLVLVSSIRTFSVEFSNCNPFCFWFPLISGTKETPSVSRLHFNKSRNDTIRGRKPSMVMVPFAFSNLQKLFRYMFMLDTCMCRTQCYLDDALNQF